MLDNQSPTLTPRQTIDVGSYIVSIASCSQFFAVGCMDDSFKVWTNKFQPFQKQPIKHNNEQISGLSDICFMQNSTHIATISLDSILKIWDLDTSLKITIDVPVMSAWKIIFVGDSLITCGDLGRILYYDLFSKEMIRKMEAGDACLSAVGKMINEKKIAVGNVNGNAYLVNVQDREQILKLKPHYKTIRSITFDHSQQRIITSSDDTTLVLTDLQKSKKIQSFEGHLQQVTSGKCHSTNRNIIFSCSLDKTIKIWDIRAKDSIYTHATGMGGPLWTIEVVGKHLLAGGELGLLQILAIQ